MPDGEPGNNTGADDPNSSLAGGAAGGATEELLNKIAHGLITKRLAAFESKTTKLINDAVAASEGRLTEAFTKGFDELPEKLKELGIGQDPKKKGGEPGEITPDLVKQSPEYKGLQRELESIRKRQEAIEADAKAKAKEVRDGRLRQNVIENLAAYGIEGKRAARAADLLVGKQARYVSDEDDSIVFETEDGDEVDLKRGLKEWAGSEDGKIFVPPSGASGSGGPPPRGPRSSHASNGQAPGAEPGSLGRMILDVATGRAG